MVLVFEGLNFATCVQKCMQWRKWKKVAKVWQICYDKAKHWTYLNFTQEDKSRVDL